MAHRSALLASRVCLPYAFIVPSALSIGKEMLWSRYRGSVDLIRNDRIAGWVWNGRAPGERLQVVVQLGEADLVETSACLYRSDLADAGIGDGFHAFDVWLKESVSDQEMDSIHVNVKGARYRLPISRGAIESPPATADRSSYDGRVGLVGNDHVAGWVWNGRAPAERLEVVVRLGEADLGETSACLYRPDLADAGIGDGFHAFDIWLKRRVSDPERHAISVSVKGTQHRIPVAPGAIEDRTLKDYRLNVYNVATALCQEPSKFGAIRFDLNNDCNLHCVYCHNPRSNEKIAFDDFRAFIDHKVIETNLFQVGCIMEPTLDGRLCDFLMMVGTSPARPKKQFVLQTNGILLHRHDYAKMRDSGLTHLQVSLDSAEPKIVSSLRSGMSLQRVARNLRDFSQKCPDVSLTFVCTVTKENISTVEQMVTMGLDLGVRDFVFREVFYEPTSDVVDHNRMPLLVLDPGDFLKMSADVISKFYGKAKFDFASAESLNVAETKMVRDSNLRPGADQAARS
jgi:sulfatase maturation enzyme AslB (radical SAM superfamily)